VKQMLWYTFEFVLFASVFVAAFVAYQMRSEPTKFIYYNF